MAYDDDLANRVRACVAQEPGLTEKRMFGGLAFMIGGNMAVAASGQGGLMLRVAPEQTESVAARKHAERFVMSGREMIGWLRIHPDGVTTSRDLRRWVAIGVEYARSLPPK